MAAPWKLTARMRSRLYQLARVRSSIPTDAQVASELGISVRAVQWHLHRWKLRYRVDILRPLTGALPNGSARFSRDAIDAPQFESAHPALCESQGHESNDGV